MDIKITLPVPQEMIEHEIARLKDELKRVECERAIIHTMFTAVQNCCSHPSYTAGYEDNWCLACGKIK
jgi:hypothetical protein